MRLILWSLVILISMGKLNAQAFYTFDYIDPFLPTFFAGFRVVNPESCIYQDSLDGIIEEMPGIVPLGIGDTMLFYSYDIALDYFFNDDGPGLYKFAQFYTPQYIGTIQEDTVIAGMTHSPNGLIYMGGTGLSTYDYNSGQLQFIGYFPDGMQAGGDLVFRDGRLYMTTIDNELVKVDINDPAQSEVVHTFPDSLYIIQGLANLPYDCDSTLTYMITADSSEISVVYELDFDDFSITQLCELPGFHQDAATDMEYILPPCEIYVNLDIDGSSGAMGNDYYRTTCAGPVPVSDEDVEVFTPFPLDSLKVSLSGVFDIGEEMIYSSGASSIGVQMLDNTTLLLVNLEDASEEDFQEALLNTFYINEAAVPSQGDRIVSISMHSSYYSSMPSTTTIVIDSANNLNLINDQFLTNCWQSEDATAILQADEGTSPYIYTWPDGVESGERPNLAVGSYPVVILDAEGCKNVDTVYITQPDSLIVSIQSVEDSICSNNGELEANVSGGTAPYSYMWNPGGNGSGILNNIPPGTYTLQVTDEQDCIANTSHTLYLSDTIYTFSEELGCEGSPIILHGETYFADTTVCLSTTSIIGCDSIHCTNLVFQDTFYQQDSYELCEGEELNWQGSSYYQDTSVCVVYVNEAGCDSTYCMNASFISRVNAIEASICEGDIFLFNGQSLTQAGNYTETISDGGFCDSLIILELESYPLPSVGINAGGSLCTDAQLALNAEGTGAYQWSTGEVSSEIEVQAGGWYYLTLTDGNGCEATDSILLSEGSPNLSYVITPTNCPGFPNGSIQIDSVWGGNPPYLYAINQSPLQGQDSFTGLEAGSYTLTVEDVDGCLRSYDVMLESASNFTFSLGDDIELSLGDSIALTPLTNATSGNLSIQWQPTDYLNCDSCIAPITKPFRTITYQAFLTDDFGCTLSDDITIVVSQKEGLFIPNAFSPNGDGRNDRLILFADASILTIDRFQIFDRWGSLVFERKDFLPNVDDGLNWGGMIKGQLAPIGAYTYAAVFRTVAGEEYVVSGIVNLLR